MLSRLRRALLVTVVASLALAVVPYPAAAADSAKVDVLLFTAVDEARQAHASTPEAVELIKMTGRRYGFDVTATDDAGMFNDADLSRFRVVVWLNTYGDVLGPAQQAAFARWMASGGGFVGVHGAARTEPDWTYFRELVGVTAIGEDSPVTQETLTVDTAHPAMDGMPSEWSDYRDQWYTFDGDPAALPGVSVLATVSIAESAPRPVTWCRVVDGGRSWYTSLGHTVDAYEDGDFMRMLRGGIWWAAAMDGQPTVDTSDAAPNWPYLVSFMAWIVAIAVGGGVAVTRLNRADAAI